MTVKVEITVNGESTSADVEPRLLLAHYLRDTLGLKGHQHRLRHHLLRGVHRPADGESVKSCTVLAVQADRQQVTTMEGLSPDPANLHPVAAAFRAEHGLQCGFCTPAW
jgi:carbon-monoxide dehydrogenase small subunit